MLSVDLRSHQRVDVYSEIGHKLWESNCLSSYFKPALLNLPRSNISISYMLILGLETHQRVCCLHLDGVMARGMLCSAALPSSVQSGSQFTE